MSAERPETDADALIDPFDCVPPTRKNFPNAAAALDYYESRAKKARKAQQLLAHGSVLARTVCEHANAAAADLAKLTPAELRKLGITPELIAELDDIGSAPAQLERALEPMATQFALAAKVYNDRAEMLETTVRALLAQAQKEGSLS